MKVDMVMPQMGESITEGTISKWLKNVGDSIAQDEIILEISTDKVDSEIPAPAAGVLAEVLFQEGDVVPVKEKIAVIDTEGVASAPSTSATSSSSAGASGGAAIAAAEPATETTPPPVAPSQSNGSSNGSSTSSGKFYSPLVRGLAEKHGLSMAELDAVVGTGRGGRVSKKDLINYVENRGSAPATPAPTPAQTTPPPAAPQATSASAQKSKPSPSMPDLEWGADGTKVVPMNGMRRAIAEHMVRSKQTSPHVYSVQDVDVSRITKWRAMHKAEFKKQEGFNLSYTPFFLEAAIKGILQFPILNSSVDGQKIIMKRNINLGCAVALGNTGLIVPVIKRSEELNLVGISRSLNDLALRARNKKLLPDEVQGGTFTVTNPGVFGTIIGTPIINQPQVAILCLNAIKKCPVVIDDMIAIREMCYLTLSYDHRIVDGSVSGRYLAFIREYLENWDMDRKLY